MKKYYLGLDEGTNSIGFALTDEKYNVIKKSGKSLWGVHLFEEAKTQEERRTNRSNVRRLSRRRQRIKFLQDIFNDEMNKVDPTFFKKMETSSYKFEDRVLGNKYNLFNDSSFTDKEYYGNNEDGKLYPTIYHLRKSLIEEDKKFDIRLVYLAIHHIIKYRGNFTIDGSFDASNENYSELFISLNDIIDKDDHFIINEKTNKEIDKIVLNTKGIRDTYTSINKIVNPNNDSVLLDIVKMISGSKVKLYKIFDDEIDKNVEICFMSSKYDDEYDELQNLLGNNIDFIDICKKIYDSIVLKRILGNNKYISYSMVERYNKHQKDLNILREYVKKNFKEKYNIIFRTCNEKINNYVKYIGSNINNSVKETISHCEISDFYSFLKKELDIKPSKNEYFDEILKDMESNDYLPKLRTRENSVFPHQIHEIELNLIIKNQSKYYPFLNDCYDDGNISINKIKSIFLYKIPYYVGPLNNKSSFSWVSRKNEKIYPWNFNNVVDKAKSAESFIKRMTNHCSYLFDCDTLPKFSLIYSKYEVLSYVNKININDEPISYEDKNDLIDNLFMKNKKVSKKQITDFFKIKYGNVKITTSQGKDLEEVECSLNSYISFKEIYGDDFDKNKNNIELIINEISIFEDKSILFDRLISIYKLSEDKAKIIKSFSYKKFGSLSKKLLVDLKTDFVIDGIMQKASIIEIMEHTNKNLMEIIHDPEYSFESQINEYNIKDEKIDYEYIKNIPTSTANKRAIWSTIKIVNELEDIVKEKIDTFFVENTRSNTKEKKGTASEKKKLAKEKERTISRKKKLIDIYSASLVSLKEYESLNIEDLNELFERLSTDSDSNLRSKKLYLYYLQLGKSLYTGKRIEIERLFSTDYDIDHIVPRSLIRDDSIDNLALVEHVVNNNKQDIYPLNDDIVTKDGKVLWKILKEKGFLSEIKYKKLIRKTELTDEEVALFVNSQLVSTNQTIKIVSNLLSSRNKECKVVWSKSQNVSDFRNNLSLYKSREANDFHHAYDAYLNVVVGNCIETKYGQIFNAKKVEDFKRNNWSLQIDKIFIDSKGNAKQIINRSGNIVWNEEIKELVLKQMEKFDIMVTTKPTKNQGMFYKQTIYSPKSDKNNLIPLKEDKVLSDTSKYGGYSNVEFSHFAIIKGKKGKREEYKFVAIPILLSRKPENELIEYLKMETQLIDIEIVLNNILKDTVINYKGYEYRIRGASDIQPNVQVNWTNKEYRYIKVLSKIKEMNIDESVEEYKYHISDNEEKALTISKDSNLELYVDIFNKFSSKPFSNCSMLYKLSEIMNNNIETFKNLSLKNQIKTLINIMEIQHCNPTRRDLSLINGSSDYGRIPSWSIKDGVTIYTLSVTGFYKKVILKI